MLPPDVAAPDHTVVDVQPVAAVGEADLRPFQVEDRAVAHDPHVLAPRFEKGGDPVEGPAEEQAAGVGHPGLQLDVAVIARAGRRSVVHLFQRGGEERLAKGQGENEGERFPHADFLCSSTTTES